MSDVEWVEESDWAKVKVGDRIRLESEDEKHEFVVQHPPFSESIFHCFMQYFQSDYTLFVERPIVALPTEPGYYLDKDDYLWRHDNMFWFHDGQIYPSKNTVRKNAPFRLLMPVDEIQAAIAKRVIAMIKWKSKPSIKSWQEGFIYTLDEHALSEISRAWGVTDE